MPHIPEEIIEQIRMRADLVELVSQVTPVHRRGNDYWACCPFHHEKTPSFKISPEKQTYYCFGCKKSGNAFSFVKETVNTDFVGAVRWLADKLGITIPETSDNPNDPTGAQRRHWKDNCLRLLNDAAVWFHENLTKPGAQPAVNYIRSRQLDNQAVNHFMLGYSPDDWEALVNWARKQGYSRDQLIATGLAIPRDSGNGCHDRFRGRLTFPIWDELGRVVGFSARILDAEAKMAKYVNSPETDFFQKGKLLYAYNFARTNFKKHGRALVCEGQLDVIACHRAGLDCAIAAQGTAFTEQHARMLKRSTQNVTLAFDADTAGQKATLRTVALLHAQGLAVSIATLPAGEDPDGIFRQQGAQALNEIMANTKPALHYILDSARKTMDLTVPENLSQTSQMLLEAIRPIPDPVARVAHCQWLAQELGVPENTIIQELDLVNRQRPMEPKKLQPLIDPRAMRQNAASSKLPVFAIPVPNEGTLQCLLALILKFESMAQQLANLPESTELIPDNPLGCAINLVLANTDQGEWGEAENILATSEFAETPAVGRVLANNDFEALIPLPDDSKETQDIKAEKAETAFSDCIMQLQRFQVEQQIQQLRKDIRTAPPEQKSDMQNKLFELIRKKQNLRSRE